MTTKIETEAKINLNEKEFYKLYNDFNSPKFFDQTNLFYSQNGLLCRIRSEKGKIILNNTGTVNPNVKFKSTQETEIEISKGNAEEFLTLYGFKKYFSYSKLRAEINLDNCILALDIIPQNSLKKYYIEIEGDEDNIEKIIQKLHLQHKSLEKKSYLEILSGGENDLH